MTEKSWFGHPRGLSTLFFTEMWERFSYYGMRAILVLFMTNAVATGGMGLDDVTATAIYGLYTAAVYVVVEELSRAAQAGIIQFYVALDTRAPLLRERQRAKYQEHHDRESRPDSIDLMVHSRNLAS